MEKIFGYYVFGGALIGAFLGWGWSASNNPIAGLAIGAFVGVAIGWFAAAAVLEKNKKESNENQK